MSIAENFEIIADAVYEKGRQDEYDAFWDIYQNKGKRINYQNGFAGKGWNDTTFNPKYNLIVVGNAGAMFQETELKDLVGILNKKGKILDTSQVTTFQNMFYYSYFLTSVPTINTLGTADNSTITGTFSYCKKLKTIELILKDNGSQSFSNTFNRCFALENLVIEGKIGQNGFNVKDSVNLTRDSILSILKALSLDITANKSITFNEVHQSIIENDEECKKYWEAAKKKENSEDPGWTFAYAKEATS